MPRLPTGRKYASHPLKYSVADRALDKQIVRSGPDRFGYARGYANQRRASHPKMNATARASAATRMLALTHRAVRIRERL
jgi:hypothetical protein